MNRKFALIIGNTEYTDRGLAQLTAPGKDAEDFARILRSEDMGAFDDVKVLLNEPEPIVRDAIFEFFDLKKRDDLLLMYFSGHGVRDEYGALHLAVKNTKRDRLHVTAIGSDFVTKLMDQSYSKRQVLILDCCNSGAFGAGAKAATGGNMGIFDAFVGREGYGRVVLTATNSIQFAWEGTRIDEILGETTENSLFTHFLVRGLEGEADLDGDGRITVDELYKYASDHIARLAPLQKPQKRANLEEGEIVLRQITRIEDIRPVPLPDDLISEIEDLRPYVRQEAVRKLELIIKGKNRGMARSAKAALEKIAADDNTTRRVAQMAIEVLDAVNKAEEERKTKEEAEAPATQKAEEASLALELEKAQAERIARDEARRRSTEERTNSEDAERVVRKTPQPTLSPKKQSTLIYAGLLSIIVGIVLFSAYFLLNAAQKANPTASTVASSPTGDATEAQAAETAMIQASQTAAAGSTITAAAESTAAAIAVSTSTALAEATNAANASATTQARENYIANAVIAAQLVHGPEDGSLAHNPDSKTVKLVRSSVHLKDFILQVTFLNPYSAETDFWDYGIGFRDEGGNEQYQLVIISTRRWKLTNQAGDTKSTIQEGLLENLDVNEGGSNVIWFSCQGNEGLLYLNGDFVANLDLSARQNSGDIWAATAFITGHEIAGSSTEYQDFSIWKIP